MVVGKADGSLTGTSGLAAGTELDARLGIVETLDAGIGGVKERMRGLSGGELLVGMACAQLAGEDHLVGLDRQRTDAAGQRLAPVATPASTMAAGMANGSPTGICTVSRARSAC